MIHTPHQIKKQLGIYKENINLKQDQCIGNEYELNWKKLTLTNLLDSGIRSCLYKWLSFDLIYQTNHFKKVCKREGKDENNYEMKSLMGQG